MSREHVRGARGEEEEKDGKKRAGRQDGGGTWDFSQIPC